MSTTTQVIFMGELFDTIKFIIPPLATLLAGYIGVRYGFKQIKIEKRLEFIEKQLKEFYSPILGRRKYIRAKSEFRLKVETISGRQWKENAQKGIQQSAESVSGEIEYNNKQLEEEFLPLYREMLTIFRDNYWLAEPETRQFYNELVEYVEGWNRWKAKGVTAETMQEIGHSEEKLKPLYDELEKRVDILRFELSQK
ncbi:MAG: hypothetical protein A2664_04310 [Candidatus Taylorbacteria bacterium RIFCSPHIGHO2_01_FULL_46_22b]|uniref:Uncharacterized protein n=1 Tax=Candidatus Taylorbacteria bacterium RIFCSPHIGHO2_01_FULL_46_22b TaxID=1802301 RepID=A0A1G2M3W6_9BACT|nr:MAG: hypothetical protein A2664_04310 [Candidatus Taylorbacteria bacterium RIFCSPHIGHO2_01_FULL_46_22b]